MPASKDCNSEYIMHSYNSQYKETIQLKNGPKIWWYFTKEWPISGWISAPDHLSKYHKYKPQWDISMKHEVTKIKKPDNSGISRIGEQLDLSNCQWECKNGTCNKTLWLFLMMLNSYSMTQQFHSQVFERNETNKQTMSVQKHAPERS